MNDRGEEAETVEERGLRVKAEETRGAPRGGTLVHVHQEVRGVAPGRFLEAFRGRPRGFWSFGGDWLAHAGTVGVVEVGAGEVPHGGRFREVRRRLAGLVPRDRPCRFFGGFAFGEFHNERGHWQGFPLARFVLPRVELQGMGQRGVLTMRGEVPPGRNPAELEEELRSRLQDLAGKLEGGGGWGGAMPGMEALGEEVDVPIAGATVGGGGGAAPRVGVQKDLWLEAVRRVVARIGRGEVEKVVLARSLEVHLEEPVDPAWVVLRLWRTDRGSRVFLFEPVAGRALLGAAPELLAEVKEGRLTVTAVAGSAAVGSSLEEQEALGRSLLGSEKDLLEHRFCVRDIVTRLRPLARVLEAEAAPRVVAFSTIQHLETRVEGQLDPPSDVFSALEALHPTPAVCGFPRDEALVVLGEEEAFPRGWYAGPVGWVDGEGNGIFVPALRSAVGGGKEWLLFAGAGIVAGSHPEGEWEETGLKFRPVLRALGVGEGGG